MDPLATLLAEAENQYDFITEEPEGGIWAWDILNNRIYLNDKLCKILDISREDLPLTSEQILSLLPPAERYEFIQKIQDVQQKNSVTTILNIDNQRGLVKQIKVKGKVSKDKQGHPARVSGLAYDITSDLQLKDAFKTAYKELTDIKYALDESTIVAITDWHGIITYANEAFCRISKYSLQELIGKTHRVINSGYHPKAFFTKMWATITAGQIWRGEIKNKAKDGTYYWVNTTIVPFLDENAKPVQYIAIRHDITRQKKAEEEVRALNESLEKRIEERTAQLKAINASLNQEIEEREKAEFELLQGFKREKLIRHILQLIDHSFDIDLILRGVIQEIGTYFEVDRCLITYYENKTEEIGGLKLSAQYCRDSNIMPIQEEEIPTIPSRQKAVQYPQVLLNASKSEDIPDSLRQYAEKYRTKSALVIEIRYKNEPFGLISLHQCQSNRSWHDEEIELLKTVGFYIGGALYQAELYQQEQLAKERAKEANLQKTKILSYVSHDFKNPIDSMLRFVEILRENEDEPPTSKQLEILGYLDEGLYQLRTMVTAILDKARLEEGQITCSPIQIELNSFLEPLSPHLQSMADHNEIEFNIEIQPGLNMVRVDPTHFRQIIMNLFSNAVKYNKKGGSVQVHLYKQDANLHLDVQDTGKGMASEEIPQIFKEFYRTDLQQANLIEGTGLGLAFIKKLIELNGGHIEVLSELGTGSTFKVILPQ